MNITTKITILAILIAVIAIAGLGKNITEKYTAGKIKQDVLITKIIDGDTLVIQNGEIIRLLGIDTDEKGQRCYNEAKDRLQELTLNKKATLETQGRDKYQRQLAYITIGGQNINKKLVEEGLAVAREAPEDIQEAEQQAIKEKRGCKWEEENKGRKQTKISVCEAKNYVGQEKTLHGKVIDVYTTKTGVTFINFEQKYPNNCFTAVIFKNSKTKFRNIESYEGKEIGITGKIKEYKGKMEIILNEQTQISIT